MSKSVTGKVLRYSLLPGLLPRSLELFASGFSYLAFFIAVIYSNIGLLPQNHPYLQPENFGRYGVRHVIAAAANGLVFTRQNLDKLIVFFTVLAGLILLCVQIILLGISLIPASSFAWTWTNTFVVTPYGPDQDVAMIVLDRVFGVQNIFNSCYSTAVDCLDTRGNIMPPPAAYPGQFHLAMHDLFMFYSMGIAFVAVIVLIYFVIAIVGETVVSGTPFGQRFNKAWVLPRLVVFFALLIPFTGGLNPGLNAAQLITLNIAKFGSNLATNTWDEIDIVISGAYATDNVSTLFGPKGSLVAIPNVPSVAKLTQFMYLVRMCMYAEKILNDRDVRPYIVRDYNINPAMQSGTLFTQNWLPFLDTLLVPGATFEEALRFSRYGSIILRFGELNLPDSIDGGPPLAPLGEHANEWGYVKPYCGELSFNFVSTEPYVTGRAALGIFGIQQNYYESIREYLTLDPTFDISAYCMARSVIPYDQDPACTDVDTTYDFQAMWSNHGPDTFPNLNVRTEWLTASLAKQAINYYDTVNQYYITGNFIVGGVPYSGTATTEFNNSILGQIRANYDFAIPASILRLGWVGLSAHYQQIADLNGNIFSAVQRVPSVNRYPLVMEIIARQHDAMDTAPSVEERFNPLLKNGKMAVLERPGDQYIAAALYSGYKFWQKDSLYAGAAKQESGNPAIDVINALFGTDGLFNMIKNEDVHPLAQLSAIGRSILESSIQNVFVGSSIGLVSDILQKVGLNVGPFPKVAGNFASRIGMIALSIGFMLFYVLPFMPFIYFFFAFGGWVKAIFEAMVAMPLWALAHVKIDGNGLPGPMATNGYFLLFEIFLRPTMIVFGFIASIVIFSASVLALNSIYETVMVNVTGFGLRENTYAGPVNAGMGTLTTQILRGPIDQFFYTVIYAVIVYMMALSSFKLIDQIPRSIMRWAGSVVSSFQERSDPGSDLWGRMSRTSNITRSQLNTSIDQIRRMGEEGIASDAVTDRQLQQQLAAQSLGKPK